MNRGYKSLLLSVNKTIKGIDKATKWTNVNKHQINRPVKPTVLTNSSS